MILKKTFKYRLKPNAKQKQQNLQFAGARRWVFNRGLDQRTKSYEKEKKSISLFEQNNELTVLKELEETKWLKSIHSQVLQQSLHDLDQAFGHFFRRVKKGETPGYPKFKCKGDQDSFRYPQGVKVKDNLVWLPKIGWVKFKKTREIEGIIKQTTIILEGDKWYVCFSCEIHTELEKQPCSDIAGVDLGLLSFAAISSNEEERKVENPRFLKQMLSHLKFLSRKLSHKVKKSKNYNQAKARLRAWHTKIRNKRGDFLHKLSTQLVKNHDAITVESLNVKALFETDLKGMRRSLSDAGWRSFLEMIRYKCEHLGKHFVEIDQFFPSSQICNACDAKNKLSLSTRIYKCACGYIADRDFNASRNLRAAGITVLKAHGAAGISWSNEMGILRL